VLAVPLSVLSSFDPGWPRQSAFAIFGLLAVMVVVQLVNTVVAFRTPIPKGRISAETLIKVTEAKRRLETIAELPEEQKQTAKLGLIRDLESARTQLAEPSKRTVDIFAGRLFTVYNWLILISLLTLNWLGMQTVRK
jgi:hypothetical protein